MSRDLKVYLEDILAAIAQIEDFTRDISYEVFAEDDVRFSAALFKLIIIGEAVKNIPLDWREKYQEVYWQGIAGLRDIIAHEYFRLRPERIWDILTTHLPILKQVIAQMLEDIDR